MIDNPWQQIAIRELADCVRRTEKNLARVEDNRDPVYFVRTLVNGEVTSFSYHREDVVRATQEMLGRAAWRGGHSYLNSSGVFAILGVERKAGHLLVFVENERADGLGFAVRLEQVPRNFVLGGASIDVPLIEKTGRLTRALIELEKVVADLEANALTAELAQELKSPIAAAQTALGGFYLRNVEAALELFDRVEGKPS